MKKRLTLIKITKREAEAQREIWVPLHESDIETSRILKIGQQAVASAKNTDIRNYRFLKKYFALMKLAYFNLPEKYSDIIKNVDELRKEILVQTGFREKHISMGGKEYFIPKSISFENMTEDEFNKVYSLALDFICQYILPGVESKDIEEQILNFM